jgi:aminoglycoside phosphotransferase (APT) family kinase protein
VSERIHDHEPDTSEATVRSLLAAQCPAWFGRPLTYLRTSGTDNAMWRVHTADHDDVVVRLPRKPGAAERIVHELDLLHRLEGTSLATVVDTPIVHHVGTPEEVFPFDWAVLGWLDGDDAWTARATLPLDDLAVDLAAAIHAIGELRDLPVDTRAPGDRGGPIGPLLDRLELWLTAPQLDAPAMIDVDAVRRLAAEAREVADDPIPRCFVHGDLIPGNLLLRDGRLTAVIDWGSAGWADPAQDLAPAWALFEGPSRQRFRDAVSADDETWLRARTFELEHAVGGTLYYRPRGHPLGDVMSRTLQRILANE